MKAINYQYPPKPNNVDEQVIATGPTFKKEVWRVIYSILFFIFVYVLLVICAVLMAMAAGYCGLQFIRIHPSFITLILGAGFIIFGIMVVFFLFKFLFKRNKVDRSGLIELRKSDQPELFNFIQKVAAETQTPFPKRIYLSPDVNASVFYDSSFLSLFLPVRKNLQIGLGLVNSLNMSEFKAVLAHEFGHFSQRSMKFGSYVYNVNRIIYNMLYDNDGYSRTLDGIAGSSAYLALFVSLTVFIVSGIQWVLQKVYAIINKSYMSLSRQMEFHADAVSAYVTGSKHLVTALKRIEVAQVCYNNLFHNYDLWAKRNIKPENIYPQHREVIQHFSKEFDMPLNSGLPDVNINIQQTLNPSRLIIKDQWASHPSTEARENKLNELNIPSETIEQSAWSVFVGKERLQQEMTQKVYKDVVFSATPSLLDSTGFTDLYYKDFKANTFDKAYEGFYDNRDMPRFDLEAEASKASPDTSMQALFTAELTQTAKKLSSLNADIETLEWLLNNKSDVKTFDFDGQKYTLKKAQPLLDQLKNEQSELQNELTDFDKKVYRFFLEKAKAKNKQEELDNLYKKCFSVLYEVEGEFMICSQVNQLLQNLFTTNMNLQEARILVDNIKDLESNMKEMIKDFLEDGDYCNEHEKTLLQNFISTGRTYLYTERFNESDLQQLHEATNTFAQVLSSRTFKCKKKLLDFQVELLN